MTTSVEKYADYKIAPPLDKSSSRRSLAQGKLSSETHSSQPNVSSSSDRHDYHTSRHFPLLSYLDNNSNEGLDSSPRSPLLPHTTGYPTTDHTHSLSLSDSDSPPSSSVHSHIPAAVIPNSSAESVLTVRAQHSSPSHSQPVKTTSTKTLSPIKVTRHFDKEDMETFDTDITTIAPPNPLPPSNGHDWRRFSSNFVSPPLFSTSGQESSEGAHSSQTTSIDPVNQSNATNLSTINEDSIENPEHNGTRDGSHVEGVRSEDGVGRSFSKEKLKTDSKEDHSVSAHSKSVNMGSAQQASLALTKKKAHKGRHVASRYMSDVSSVRKPPISQSGRGKTASLKAGSSVAKKSKASSKPPPHVPPDSHKASQRVRLATSIKQPPVSVRGSLNTHPSTPSHNHSALSMSFSPSGIMTSTPAPSRGGGNDGSFIVMDTMNDSNTTAGDYFKKLTHGIGENEELELMHTRLLQLMALNVMSAQSLREQDQEAKSQLYTLWKAVEDKKQAKLDLMKSLETERRNLALDKTINTQLQGLGPVVSGLSQLERSYTAMARALDTTRHDLALKGMLPVDEEHLAEQLAESEELLGDIMRITRTKVPKVTSFAESTEAVVATLSRELEQLEKCWSTLEAVTKLQLHEASVYLENRQRTM